MVTKDDHITSVNGNSNSNSAVEDAFDPVDLTRLASWWRPGEAWDKKVEETEWENVPAHLNTVNSSGKFQSVSIDMLSVRYTGLQMHGNDVGAVQADYPAPTKRVLYYFEMTVKNAGTKGQVSIGFTPPGFKTWRQPGWEPNSCGYHGDDGFLYTGKSPGDKYGPTFTSGDTVGAGINYALQEFFFTKNGELVGTPSPKNIKGDLFPTIAVHSQNEEVTVNFGNQPFLFNIEAFELEKKQKQQAVIDETPLPANLNPWIVRSYLLHYGYENTLNSLDTESRNALPSIKIAQEGNINEHGEMFALHHRMILRKLIRGGDIDSVFIKLQEWYPHILQNEMSTMAFLLYSQRFIEYIRDGKSEDAVKYARMKLVKFFPIKSFETLLQDCISLLAYEDPLASCVGYLLDTHQRDIVADAVNVMVLLANPNSKTPKGNVCSLLEKLLRQLTACFIEGRDLNGQQGEVFNLHSVLHTTDRRGKC